MNIQAVCITEESILEQLRAEEEEKTEGGREEAEVGE